MVSESIIFTLFVSSGWLTNWAKTGERGPAGTVAVGCFQVISLTQANSTTRTSKVTLSQILMASKIAARLSMLGLPFGESMRCRLLLGLRVIVVPT